MMLLYFPDYVSVEWDKFKMWDAMYNICTISVHVLLWAKFSRAFEVLLSAQGMSRMLSRGLLTREQFSLLQSLDPKVGAHNACLEWLIIRALRGTRNGSLDDCMSLRKVFLDKACELRGTAAGIGDILDGRMPLAYVHFVQVLVDAFLVAAPFALYAELGILSILSVGILTLFYSGLLDLAKILLDPLDNEDFYKESVNMDIGVLIRESNAGSTRWKAATEKLPFR
jgi:predicted membrane chloride channel (bestrophin family)